MKCPTSSRIRFIKNKLKDCITRTFGLINDAGQNRPSKHGSINQLERNHFSHLDVCLVTQSK